MKKAIELAELIADVLGEGIYADSKRQVRKSTILLTAGIIQQDIEKGILVKGENKAYWHINFVDDYGGHIERDLDEESKPVDTYLITEHTQ